MLRNIYIDSFGNNVHAAVTFGGRLVEYHVEPLAAKKTVGTIYKGKVVNVLNGMQAAFVNIGLEKNGYLFVGDMLIDKAELDGKIDIPTTLNLNVGDEIMVQAIKAPFANKGARLTSVISFAGKYIVLLPFISFVGISRKITSADARDKLTAYANKLTLGKYGLIMRTAAEFAAKKVIRKEYEYLLKQFEKTQGKFDSSKSGEILHEDCDLVVRMLRDVCTPDMDKIYVSSPDLHQKISGDDYFKSFEKTVDLILYKGQRDMFKHFGLDGDISGMLKRRVDLQSGAYIVFDKTEALTVIDVNTGSFIGSSDLEDTVYNTNILAAKEIARQVRLRNISGIIVVDFIDMEREENKQSVVNELELALKDDRVRCNVIGMSALGLVEFTRKKMRRDISQLLKKPCPVCVGDGTISSDDYTVMRIRTALLDLFADGYKNAIVDLSEDLAKYILSMGVLSKEVNGFWQGKRIYLVPHKSYNQQCFKIRGDNSDVLDLPKNSLILY